MLVSECTRARAALMNVLCAQVQSDGILSVEGVAAAMATAFPEAPQTVFTEDLQRQEEAAAFFEAKGLRSLPQVLLNGVQLEVEEVLVLVGSDVT